VQPTSQEDFWQQQEEKKDRMIKLKLKNCAMLRATRTDHSKYDEVAPGITNGDVDKEYDERAAHIIPFDVTAETKLINELRRKYPKWYPFHMREEQGLTKPNIRSRSRLRRR
jgi:hypothetical protein